jgi:hypothetical protein
VPQPSRSAEEASERIAQGPDGLVLRLLCAALDLQGALASAGGLGLPGGVWDMIGEMARTVAELQVMIGPPSL